MPTTIPHSRPLADHPRLYVSAQQLAAVGHAKPPNPLMTAAAKAVAQEALAGLTSTQVPFDPARHNGHLIRARRMQTRVLSLIVRWRQTRQPRYRDAAYAHLLQMDRWKYWSWITWRKGDSAPDAIFDLSYGENSLTLGLAYDWLYADLSPHQRATLRDIARRRSLRSFLKHVRPRYRMFWFGKQDSNWNAVCAGGAGVLALAMYDELPEARRALPSCEQSLAPYMLYLDKTRGGWPEGLGYWNFGMRYALLYLLSHEHATGLPHQLLRRPATRKTLWFPLDFCPNGVPCGFGDANSWQPMPVHLAAARALDDHALEASLWSRLKDLNLGFHTWPDAAELLLLGAPSGRRQKKRTLPAKTYAAKLYRDLDWGYLADRMPDPRLYLAIRGGTTEVPHGHVDLLSFFCVVGDEALITNLGLHEYLDTTFSPRRYELFEASPASKNTLFINGVGPMRPATVKTTLRRFPKVMAMRLDATQAMGRMYDGHAAKFCARLFVLLGPQAALFIDRVVLTHPGRIESRLFTPAQVTAAKDQALLQGQRQNLRLACASTVPCALHTAHAALTTPTHRPTMLRWCTDGLVDDAWFVTALLPGAATASLRADSDARGRLTVQLRSPSRRWRFSLNPTLTTLRLRQSP